MDNVQSRLRWSKPAPAAGLHSLQREGEATKGGREGDDNEKSSQNEGGVTGRAEQKGRGDKVSVTQ